MMALKYFFDCAFEILLNRYWDRCTIAPTILLQEKKTSQNNFAEAQKISNTSTMADALTTSSRSFYERSKAKLGLSIVLGAASMMLLGFCSTAGGLVRRPFTPCIWCSELRIISHRTQIIPYVRQQQILLQSFVSLQAFISDHHLITTTTTCLLCRMTQIECHSIRNEM